MHVENIATHPIVGRAGELARVEGLTGLDDGSRAAGVAIVAGDAGVGKTRLLGELGARARRAGWRVLVGHCLDFGDSALPYLPFTEVFGELAATDPYAVERLADELPAVRRLLPGQRVMSDAEHGEWAGMERSDLLEAVHRALERLATDCPLLVVLEDVHWADPSTRELLTFLFTRRFSGRVSLIVSYRSDDLHRRHPLRSAVAEWSRLRGVTRVTLSALRDEDVRTLVRSLQPAPIRDSEVDAIVTRAEGNAFFIEELVGATQDGRGALPDDLAELLLLRLDQLDDDARTVVRAASAAGHRVPYALLARVLAIDPPSLDAALRMAVERNVLVPASEDGYAFRHALLGEAVYGDLLPGERVRLHSAYADALRSREVDGTAADLARHARAAHDTATALRASVKAGDDATAVGGPDEAASHYELALELTAQAEPAHDVDVVDLTVKAGKQITAAGSPHRAIGVVREQLRRVSGTVGDDDRVRLLVALASAVLVTDSDIDALELTTQALALVPADEASERRARVMGVHALANADRLRDDDAARWADEAAALGNVLGLPDVVADATTTRGRLDGRTGDPEGSKRLLERAIGQARNSDDILAEMRGLHQLGGVHYELAEFDDALRCYRLASERAASIGWPWAPYGIDSRLMAALTAYAAGHWDLASSLTDVSGQSPPPVAEAGLAVAAMVIGAGRGDAAALELSPRVRPWWTRDGMIAILGCGAEIDLHGDLGDADGAVEAHDAGIRAAEQLWQWKGFPARVRLSALLLGQLANHASATTDADRDSLTSRASELVAAAEGAMDEADARRRPMGPEGIAWHVRVRAEDLRLRWLLGVGGRADDDLVAAWRQAVESFETFGTPFEIARCQVRLAQVLRSSGRREEANALTDEARAVATRLDAKPLLAELGATADRSRTEPRDAMGISLTPREYEVLVLVADGHSNADIARRLVISAKTVSVHVSNILAKLGAAGRTEAAAIARRQGLLPD